MRKYIDNHGKKIVNHVKKHHRKYIFGTVGGLFVVKIFTLLIGSFGLINNLQQGPIHAEELNTYISGLNFENNTGLDLGMVYVSNTGYVLDITGGLEIYSENIFYIINTGDLQSNTGTLYSGDTINLIMTTADDYKTVSTGVFVIDGNEYIFELYTKKEPFAYISGYYNGNIFDHKTGVQIDSLIESKTGKIINSGNGGIDIIVNSGFVKINSGNINNTGKVYSGDTVKFYLQSNTGYLSLNTGIINIGEFDLYFVLETQDEPLDDEPDDITFDIFTGVNLNTGIVSNVVVVLDINTGINLSVSGLDYRINGGTWHTGDRLVYDQDAVEVKIVSSEFYNTCSTGILELGEKSFDFFVKTKTGVLNSGTDNIGDVEEETNLCLTGYFDINQPILNKNYSGNIDFDIDYSGCLYSGIDVSLLVGRDGTGIVVYTGNIDGIDLYYDLNNTGFVEKHGEYEDDLDIFITNNTGKIIYYGTSYFDFDIQKPEMLDFVVNYTGINSGYIGQSGIIDMNWNFSENISGKLYILNKNFDLNQTGFDVEIDKNFDTGLLVYKFEFEDNLGNSNIDLYTGDIEVDNIKPYISGFVITGVFENIFIDYNSDKPVKYFFEYELSGNYVSGYINTGRYEYKSGYITGVSFVVTGRLLKTGIYNYVLTNYDILNNKNILEGSFEFDEYGVLSENNQGIETLSINSSNSNTLGVLLLRKEIQKFMQCKENIEFINTNITINGVDYNLNMPVFSKDYIKNIVNILGQIIITKIKGDKSLKKETVQEILKRYENFLIVFKLLRDNDVDCEQKLSNYHITRFQSALEKYSIFFNPY